MRRFCLLVLLFTIPTLGVAQNRKVWLQQDSYHLLGDLSLSALAPDGSWIAYHMAYSDGDTLFVRQPGTNKRYTYPKGRSPHFTDSNTCLVTMPGNQLRITGLTTGQMLTIANAASYQLLNGTDYLLTVADQDDGQKALQIYNWRTGKEIRTFGAILDFSYNQGSKALALVAAQTGGSVLKIVRLKDWAERVVYSSSGSPPTNTIWQQDGKAIAFCLTSGTSQKLQEVYCYNLAQGTLASAALARNRYAFIHVSSLQFSPDGSTVAITAQPLPLPSPEPGTVQVWNGNDTLLFPLRQRDGEFLRQVCLSWRPEDSTLVRVNTDAMPFTLYTASHKFALVRDLGGSTADSLLHPPSDYYITDVATGDRKLLLQRQSSAPGFVHLSPLTDMIVLYWQGNWYSHDPRSGNSICLTRDIKTHWDTSGTNALPPTQPYGMAGWTNDAGAVLLYDSTDIYLAATNGSYCKKLTDGKGQGMVYRLVAPEGSNVFGLDRLLVLATDTKDNTESYLNLTGGSHLEKIDGGKGHLRQPLLSSGGDLVYISEGFDTPGAIRYKKASAKKAETLYVSNRLQDNFFWGTSKVITYRNWQGTSSKAALFFPAGYIKGKRYPMITFVYQDMSDRVHHYEKPSLENSAGFNVSHYTLNGYLVLLPDILYKTGDPGKSAAFCITAAVQKVVDMGIADSSALGLIGTSFGGYETSFTLSQSKLFAAGVAGALIGDLTASYFSLGEQFLRPELWRYESQIFRMGQTYFDNRKAYLDNSPLYNAKSITTPLLLWCGTEDPVVPWTQSLSLYLALRRLGGKAILLAYPGESHALLQPQNQSDLSVRVFEWFNYFLKKESTHWISKGTK